MAKKTEKLNFENIFVDAIREVKKNQLGNLLTKPVDIITYSEDILGEKLYPSQKVILKFFYAGTRFNSSLLITQEDIDFIKKLEIEQDWILFGKNSKLKIIEEIIQFNLMKKDIFFSDDNKYPYKFFKDLVLVIGRRASKSYLTSLIASYEAYKLIMLKDPQKFYGINSDIYILNAAVSAEQAKNEIFKEIKKFVYKCPVFDGRINREYDDSLRLWTDRDIELNKKIKKRNGKLLDGSVVIMSGSSNSSSLRGKAAIVVIYDELAHFVEGTGGKSSAEEVFNALSRSTRTFSKFGDGRNIAISSPYDPTGFFYDLYEKSKRIKSMLMFQAPTWDINPNITKESLSDEFEKDPDNAWTEYGARFRRRAGNIYFPDDKIEKAFTSRDGWLKKTEGTPGRFYFLHIDAGDTSDRYAFMICHPENIFDQKSNTYIQYVVEDYSCFITPKPGSYIDPDNVVDEEILPLFDKFNIVSVSYDGQFTREQQKKIKAKSVNTMEIRFAGRQKNNIYDATRNLFLSNRIILCRDDYELEGELKNILVDHRKDPPKIDKNTESQFPYDDVVDCLCGNVYAIMLDKERAIRLPRAQVVKTRLR